LLLRTLNSNNDNTFLHFLSTNGINEYWIGCVFHPFTDLSDYTEQSINQKWIKMACLLECCVALTGKWLPMSEGIIASSYLITQMHTSLTDVIHTHIITLT